MEKWGEKELGNNRQEVEVGPTGFGSAEHVLLGDLVVCEPFYSCCLTSGHRMVLSGSCNWICETLEDRELFQVTLAIQLQNEGKSVSEVMEGEDIEEEEELGLEKTDQPGKEAGWVRPGWQWVSQWYLSSVEKVTPNSTGMVWDTSPRDARGTPFLNGESDKMIWEWNAGSMLSFYKWIFKDEKQISCWYRQLVYRQMNLLKPSASGFG